MRLVKLSDVPAQPWRNGGGVTRELAAWPNTADWQVRLSVADIERDGPFSAYPGVQRWFAVLKGAGVVLTLGGAARHLTRTSAPLAFDGAAAPDCHLIDGPTRDLNLMLRGARGTLRLVDDGQPWAPVSAMCGLFSAVAGRCSAGTTEIDVPAYALLWFDEAPPALSFCAGERPAAATGWWIAATTQEDRP